MEFRESIVSSFEQESNSSVTINRDWVWEYVKMHIMTIGVERSYLWGGIMGTSEDLSSGTYIRLNSRSIVLGITVIDNNSLRVDTFDGIPLDKVLSCEEVSVIPSGRVNKTSLIEKLVGVTDKLYWDNDVDGGEEEDYALEMFAHTPVILHPKFA